jgi:hypothetical protein
MIKLCYKILQTILADRMQHTVAAQPILTAPQAAFVNGRSCEEHIFTLNEAIKARLRKGLPTYVLFVDFKTAYNTVNLPLLMKCLKANGYDDRFSTLVGKILSEATAKAKINGKKTGPIPTRTGVPQGGPLSCLLFNIFIESLSRYLSTRPDLHGVEVLGKVIRHLLFADDLAVLASSAEELERALGYINGWAKAWGMSINVKKGKTEAMQFTPQSIRGSSTNARNLPPLKAGDLVVNWTAGYKYLGYILRFDLSTDHIIAHKANCGWGAFQKIQRRTPQAYRASTAEQIQITNTYQQGQFTYGLSLLEINEGQMKEMDESIIASAYEMLGRKKCHSTSMDAAMAGTRSLHASEIAARERERLRLTLEHSDFRKLPAERWPPALHIYDALKNEPTSSKSLSGKLHNWVHLTSTIRGKHMEEGAMGHLIPTPTRPTSECAHSYARSLAYSRLKSKIGEAPPGATTIPVGEPNTRGSTKNFLTLSFWLRQDVAQLGEAAGHTPLSIIGPGTCSGSILALGLKGSYARVKNLWLGSEACNLWPFRDNTKPHTLRSIPHLSHASRHSKNSCRTCTGDHETIWHLACACPHPTLVAARHDIWAGCKNLLLQVVEKGSKIMRGSAVPTTLSTNEKMELEALLLQGDANMALDEKNFLIYWTLAAAPWPAGVANPLQQRTSHLLGKFFSSISLPSSKLHNLADTWLTWSENAISTICKAHHLALLQPHQ